MDLVVCTGLRRHDHVVLCLAHRVRAYMKTYIIIIIIRVHHVQKYTRAILPHAALCHS